MVCPQSVLCRRSWKGQVWPSAHGLDDLVWNVTSKWRLQFASSPCNPGLRACEAPWISYGGDKTSRSSSCSLTLKADKDMEKICKAMPLLLFSWTSKAAQMSWTTVVSSNSSVCANPVYISRHSQTQHEQACYTWNDASEVENNHTMSFCDVIKWSSKVRKFKDSKTFLACLQKQRPSTHSNITIHVYVGVRCVRC